MSGPRPAHAAKLKKATRVQLYLPIADIPVNVFLILAMGAAVGLRIRHVRHRRRLPTTPLLIFVGIRPRSRSPPSPSHIAASSLSGAYIVLASARHRHHTGAGVIDRRHLGTALGVWTFTLLRALGQLDLLIALSYVILLTTVGGLMFWEGLRAMLRARSGDAVPSPPGQPWLDPRPAAEDAFQALENLSVGDPGYRDRARSSASSAP